MGVCSLWRRVFFLFLSSYLIVYNFSVIGVDMVLFFWVRAARWGQALWDRVLCFVTRGRRLLQRRTRQRLHQSRTYAEWRGFAADLDRLEGNDKWRAKYESTAYDFEVVRAQLGTWDWTSSAQRMALPAR